MNGLVQERRNSIANRLELSLPSAGPVLTTKLYTILWKFISIPFYLSDDIILHGQCKDDISMNKQRQKRWTSMNLMYLQRER